MYNARNPMKIALPPSLAGEKDRHFDGVVRHSDAPLEHLGVLRRQNSSGFGNAQTHGIFGLGGVPWR